MKYLFFDTETTGVPKNYSAPASEVDNWPRVIQLAYQVYDENEALVKECCQLIKPDGWEIPAEKFWIDNGYTTEKSLSEGVPLLSVLQEFVNDRAATAYHIAHNISFDSKILRAEMIRANIDIEFTGKKVCTMQAGTSHCAIPSTRGFKWPKLIELHNKLFNEGFEGAHDALADVKACARCFFEMKRLGLITID